MLKFPLFIVFVGVERYCSKLVRPLPPLLLPLLMIGTPTVYPAFFTGGIPDPTIRALLPLAMLPLSMVTVVPTFPAPL